MGETGLKLSKEVSLEINWLDFSEKLAKSVVDGFKAFNGDFKSGIDAVSALFGAAKAINQDISIEARALELVLLCFAWSFDSLRASGHLKEKQAKDAARKAVALLKEKADAGQLKIPYDFFDNPQSAEAYQLLRYVFHKSRANYRPSKKENEAVFKARFDSAFRSAVWNIWSARAPIFEELARTLDSPAAKTADFERQWQAYRESLIREFHVDPVFGQEETNVSLGQLFVPLRCFWREMVEPVNDEKSFERERQFREESYHVLRLQDELDQWLDNGNEADWLRLIGGGPGSGKSTSAKAFAARVALREDLRPIFIPLTVMAAYGTTLTVTSPNRAAAPFKAHLWKDATSRTAPALF